MTFQFWWNKKLKQYKIIYKAYEESILTFSLGRANLTISWGNYHEKRIKK